MINRSYFSLMILAFLFAGHNAEGQRKTKLKTRADSISYALGVSLGQGISDNGFSNIQSKVLLKGIEDIYSDEAIMTPQEANQLVSGYMSVLKEEEAERNLLEGQEFLEKNKENPDVTTLPSGLQYKIIEEGEGTPPSENDEVTVHYTGTLLDGTVFDSSVERGEPVSFPVNRVIEGWTEALQLMKPGAKWMLYIPSDLAYGEEVRPGGPIKANMALLFEVELISVNRN